MSTSANLDPAAVARLCRLGGNKFAREMIDLFLDYSARKAAEARQARESGDLTGLAKAAHPLKSSAGNVGACQVQAIATRLEKEAQSGQSEPAAASLAALEQALTEVRQELDALRQTLVDSDASSSPP